MIEDFFLPVIVVGMLFLGLPWLIFHYVTQWKRSGSLSLEDENLLDELNELARKLDERLRSIERIIAADDPSVLRTARDRDVSAGMADQDDERQWRRDARR